MAKKTKSQILAAFKAKQARELAKFQKSLERKSVARRRSVVKSVRETSKIKAKKPSKSLKLKTKSKVRKTAKAISKAARTPFLGGLTKQVAKGYRAIKELITKPKRRTTEQKEKALGKIGIRLYKVKRKRTAKQKRKITKLYTEFAEFTGRPGSYTTIKTTNKDTLEKARKSGMAIYKNKIYVHIATPNDTARMGTKRGEKIIKRTYHGKSEQIFIGGADVFQRVVSKFEVNPPKPGELITGSFFGGPTFHKAIFASVAEFMHYMNNAFVPGKKFDWTKPIPKRSKRNILRDKSGLMKQIAIVTIDNPEFTAKVEKGLAAMAKEKF